MAQKFSRRRKPKRHLALTVRHSVGCRQCLRGSPLTRRNHTENSTATAIDMNTTLLAATVMTSYRNCGNITLYDSATNRQRRRDYHNRKKLLPRSTIDYFSISVAYDRGVPPRRFSALTSAPSSTSNRITDTLFSRVACNSGVPLSLSLHRYPLLSHQHHTQFCIIVTSCMH